MDRGTKNKKRVRYLPLIILIVGITSILLYIEYTFLTTGNQVQAYRTADVLISQVENILSNNERKTDTLTEALKENYITKAKAVAYIVDHVPETENNLAELKRIAELMSIDEIHIFDDTGRIYSGTVTIYYGYSFESGEQMAFFTPMLDDRSLSMCQDVTPNTAENKSMMYAICWNDSGNKMIQIGIEPLRLLDELPMIFLRSSPDCRHMKALK